MSRETAGEQLPDLQALVDGLARAAAADPAAAEQIAALQRAADAVARATSSDGDEPEARAQAADGLELLADELANVARKAAAAAAAPTATEEQRAVLRSTDFEQLARTLRLLATWLRDPASAERDPDVKALVENMKTLAAKHAAATEAQLDREIKEDVRRGLDEIFSKPIKLDLD